MNWIALGAVAETLGVIILIISVVYLAIQIRQNTEQMANSNEATRLAAFERNIESGNRMREHMFLHPDLAALYVKGKDDFFGLDAVEKLRFSMLLRNIFASLQGGYIRFITTQHDPEGFAGSIKIIDELLGNPGVRDWLEKTTLDWRSEFQKLVNDRLQLAVDKIQDND